MEFHVSWHRCPNEYAYGPEWAGPSGLIPTLALTGGELTHPWAFSFEEAVEALAAMERLYAEPDGSFVWRPAAGQQVDGQLFDRAGRLAYVELHGRCDAGRVDQLFAALNPAQEPLAVQLTRDGVILRFEDWRSCLA